MDIKLLLKKIQAGEAQAFAEVVKHYQRPLFGFLGRMALSQAHAEEVAQETFLRAWRNIGDYKPELAEFSTWLFAIARNLALNELSRAAYQRESAEHENLPEATCEKLQPLDALARSEQKMRLQSALRQLPPLDRSALALAYMEELDMAAIATMEGCSVGAIKTRLHRAKEKLRHLLGGQNG